MADSLGDRIKRYERAAAVALLPRSCLVVRVDGKAFHSYTRRCARPFDESIIAAMVYATKKTAADMMGFRLGYTQSDEATFLLTDFDTHTTQGWFNYELAKVVSISASLFTAHFNDHYARAAGQNDPALFDSRAFNTPTDDAPNVFLWRQRDWERNSLQMFARAHFSHNEMFLKSHVDLHEMLHQKGLNWASLDHRLKNGTFLLRDGTEVCDKLDYDGIRALMTSMPDEVAT